MRLPDAFAEFERALIRERQLEGIALVKARGAYTGRKPSLSTGQAETLRARVAAGEPKAGLAREFGIAARPSTSTCLCPCRHRRRPPGQGVAGPAWGDG